MGDVALRWAIYAFPPPLTILLPRPYPRAVSADAAVLLRTLPSLTMRTGVVVSETIKFKVLTADYDFQTNNARFDETVLEAVLGKGKVKSLPDSAGADAEGGEGVVVMRWKEGDLSETEPEIRRKTAVKRQRRHRRPTTLQNHTSTLSFPTSSRTIFLSAVVTVVLIGTTDVGGGRPGRKSRKRSRRGMEFRYVWRG
jgi:hypothetical protein